MNDYEFTDSELKIRYERTIEISKIGGKIASPDIDIAILFHIFVLQGGGGLHGLLRAVAMVASRDPSFAKKIFDAKALLSYDVDELDPDAESLEAIDPAALKTIKKRWKEAGGSYGHFLDFLSALIDNNMREDIPMYGNMPALFESFDAVSTVSTEGDPIELSEKENGMDTEEKPDMTFGVDYKPPVITPEDEDGNCKDKEDEDVEKENISIGAGSCVENFKKTVEEIMNDEVRYC